MNKIAIFIILALVAVSPGCIKHKAVQPTIPAQPLVTVPPEYQAWYNDANSWLDEKITEWKPTSYKPMKFGAYHLPASDDVYPKSTLDLNLGFIDMLNGVNPDLISLYIQLPIYKADKANYDKVIQKIKADSDILIHFTWTKKTSIDAIKAEGVDFINQVVAVHKPAYFVLMNEPTWVTRNTMSTATSDDWKDIAQYLAVKAKEVSPNTKTQVNCNMDCGEINNACVAVADIPEIDIIGFNLYTEKNAEKICVTNAIDAIEAKGKETSLSETWHQYKSDKEFYYAWKEPLDAKWIRVMTYFAQQYKMDYIVPFFTVKFVDYFPETAELSDLQQALNEKRRTAVFYSYQDVINETR